MRGHRRRSTVATSTDRKRTAYLNSPPTNGSPRVWRLKVEIASPTKQDSSASAGPDLPARPPKWTARTLRDLLAILFFVAMIFSLLRADTGLAERILETLLRVFPAS